MAQPSTMMKLRINRLVLAAAFAAWFSPPAAPAADRDKNMSAPVVSDGRALEVGAMAPEFALRDASGHDVSLDGLLSNGPVALVFYRSAEWCPFCVAQLKELQTKLAAFEQAGLQLVGISYDEPAVLARAARKHGLTFPLLSDADSAAIDAFGIRNHAATGKAAGVPHPAVFIVAPDGSIRARLMHETYRTRPTPAEVIAAAQEGETRETR